MRDRGLAAAWSTIAALAIALAFIVPAGAVGQGGGTTPPAPILTVHNTATNATASAIPATSCASGYATPWGDCLRGPWVPYPAPPSVAPDGLSFGSVGQIGAQGQVGASSFTQGTATTLGVSPCATYGCVTTINQNSFWANRSYSLLGNVSVQGPYSLTIYNAQVVFYEPAINLHYSRGFNVSSNGVAASLLVEHGASVSQVNSSGNAWFIGTYYRSTAPSANWYHNISISKIIADNATVGLGAYYYGGHLVAAPLQVNPTARADTEGYYFSYFNYSTYNGGPQYNSSAGLIVGGAAHSLISNGSFAGFVLGNDRFDNASVGIMYPDGYNRTGTLSFNQSTVEHQWNESQFYEPCVPLIGLSAPVGCASNVGAQRVYIDHDLFENGNISYLSDGAWRSEQYNLNVYSPLATSAGRLIDIENDTLSNLTDWGAVNHGYNTVYLASPYGYVDAGTSIVLKHDTVTRIYSGNNGSPQDFTLVNFANNMTARYDLFDGLYNTYHSEPIPLSFGATNSAYWSNVSFDNNIVENFGTTKILMPLTQNQMNYRTDYGTQEYFDVGGTNGGGTRVVHNDYFANIQGQAWFFQDTGLNDRFYNLTLVNMSTAGGIGVSVETGSVNSYVANVTCYGEYNYSYCVGSDFGGAANTNYTAIHFNDVDLTSYGIWNSGSSETLYDMTIPAYFATNGNGSNAPGNPIGTGPVTGVYTGHTTVQTFRYDTLEAFNASGLLTTSFYAYRTALGTDFNFTTYDSYVPASLLLLAKNVSTGPDPSTSFLNLTGYLGLYAGQTYYINSSNIKSESALPVRLYTIPSQIASVPHASGNGWLYTLSVTSPLSYTIGANSSKAPPVAVSFGGLNVGEAYSLLEYNSSTGARINGPQNVLLYPTTSGWINVTYNPATMPTDPTQITLEASNGIEAIAGGTGGFVLLLVSVFGVMLIGTAFGAYLMATNRREDGP